MCVYIKQFISLQYIELQKTRGRVYFRFCLLNPEKISQGGQPTSVYEADGVVYTLLYVLSTVTTCVFFC